MSRMKISSLPWFALFTPAIPIKCDKSVLRIPKVDFYLRFWHINKMSVIKVKTCSEFSAQTTASLRFMEPFSDFQLPVHLSHPQFHSFCFNLTALTVIFQIKQAAVFNEKALNTHCSIPAQQQTADRKSYPAGEHSGAFENWRAWSFPQETKHKAERTVRIYMINLDQIYTDLLHRFYTDCHLCQK